MLKSAFTGPAAIKQLLDLHHSLPEFSLLWLISSPSSLKFSASIPLLSSSAGTYLSTDTLVILPLSKCFSFDLESFSSTLKLPLLSVLLF